MERGYLWATRNITREEWLRRQRAGMAAIKDDPQYREKIRNGINASLERRGYPSLTKAILEEYLAKNMSIQEISKILKRSKTTIYKWIHTYSLKPPQIQTRRPKSNIICNNCNVIFDTKFHDSKFCSLECWRESKYKDFIERWKMGDPELIIGKITKLPDPIRHYLFERSGNKCEKCGWAEINPVTHRIPLTAHHKNGNCMDNKEENLELLCPNCHSLTENYGSLNRNSKRISRRHTNQSR